MGWVFLLKLFCYNCFSLKIPILGTAGYSFRFNDQTCDCFDGKVFVKWHTFVL